MTHQARLPSYPDGIFPTSLPKHDIGHIQLLIPQRTVVLQDEGLRW